MVVVHVNIFACAQDEILVTVIFSRAILVAVTSECSAVDKGYL